MGEKYNKNDLKNYEKFEYLQKDAIKYAEKLWHSHDQQLSSSISGVNKLIKKHNINPSTTVYQLVDKLIKCLE